MLKATTGPGETTSNRWSKIKYGGSECREAAISCANQIDGVLKDRDRFRTPEPLAVTGMNWVTIKDDENIVWASRFNKLLMKHVSVGVSKAVLFCNSALHAPLVFFLCSTHYSCGMLIQSEALHADLEII